MRAYTDPYIIDRYNPTPLCYSIAKASIWGLIMNSIPVTRARGDSPSPVRRIVKQKCDPQRYGETVKMTLYYLHCG